MHRIKRIKAKAGETLVEVMASMFIFLIMFGVLEGAISYSNSALKKNKEIRADNAVVLEGLQSSEETVTGSQKTIWFRAADSGLTKIGNVVFSVDATLDSKQVTYTDAEKRQQNTTFYLYGPVAASSEFGQTDAEGGD